MSWRHSKHKGCHSLLKTMDFVNGRSAYSMAVMTVMESSSDTNLRRRSCSLLMMSFKESRIYYRIQLIQYFKFFSYVYIEGM